MQSDSATTISRGPTPSRIAIGICVGVLAGVASGVLVANAGVGIFAAWLILSGACPAVAAIATPVHRRAMAVIASASMMTIVLGRLLFFPDGGPLHPSDLPGVL